jgi:o-succinylbenzoate synthase
VNSMELWASPYTLKSLRAPNARSTSLERSGALIKIVNEKGVGYADVHPWPSLGDVPLNEQLTRLRAGHTTALTRRSLEFAKLDLEFRVSKRSAFQGLEIPQSHFLVSDLFGATDAQLEALSDLGFKALKIKLGRELARELRQLVELRRSLSKFRLRFDFNGMLAPEDFLEFSRELPDLLRERIDFIEDPMPWHAQEWQKAHVETGLPLALDRLSESQLSELERAPSSSYQWCILKPAVQDPDELVALAKATGARLAVTSYMDHPLGQITAAFEAARLAKAGVPIGACGLMTHFTLEETNWTRAIETTGAEILPPSGFGFGFDRLLENESWERLR